MNSKKFRTSLYVVRFEKAKLLEESEENIVIKAHTKSETLI